MKTVKPNTFTPPTAEQVEAHLLRHQPQTQSRWSAWLPMGLFLLVTGLTFTTNSPVIAVLPWLFLLGFITFLNRRVQATQSLVERVGSIHDLAVLRHYTQSLRLAWQLLGSLRQQGDLHAKTVAMIAHNLEQIHAYDASVAAYDYLLNHLPANHPAALQLKIHRTLAHLSIGQLADADHTIRKLKHHMDTFSNTVISASYRLVKLLQQVRTNHFHDAVEEIGDLENDLRPLGIDAGYGYALMALSYHYVHNGDTLSAASHTFNQAKATDKANDESNDESNDKRCNQDQASHWWKRATLLLPAETLAARFSEVRVLCQATDHQVTMYQAGDHQVNTYQESRLQ